MSENQGKQVEMTAEEIFKATNMDVNQIMDALIHSQIDIRKKRNAYAKQKLGTYNDDVYAMKRFVTVKEAMEAEEFIDNAGFRKLQIATQELQIRNMYNQELQQSGKWNQVIFEEQLATAHEIIKTFLQPSERSTATMTRALATISKQIIKFYEDRANPPKSPSDLSGEDQGRKPSAPNK